MSEDDLTNLLRKKYPAPAFAFLAQVRNTTGFVSRIRTADALVMSLYPSRGLDLDGFEIKVSRSDWCRERKQPAKAESIARFCNHWWVLAPAEVVPVDELPATWGLMESDGKRIAIAKPAAPLTPEPMSVGFLASILRNVAEATVPLAAVTNMVVERVSVNSECIRRESAYEIETLRREVQRLQGALAKVRDALGVSPEGASLPHLAKAYQLVMAGDHAIENYVIRARRAAEGLKAVATDASNMIAQLEVLA